MNFLESWRRSWRELGVGEPDEPLFNRLLDCYAEPQRHYHTQQHLAECLQNFGVVRQLAARPAEVELALWFHDAIYDTRAHDNEARSAAWAREHALSSGCSAAGADRLYRLVMATRHDAVPDGFDAQILVDVDLSILGAAPARFAEYEHQVRAEYAWVPDAEFRAGRRRILQAFARRPVLYSTEAFRAKYELQARDNLTRSLAALLADAP
ncbi:HD domain-containing protein [Solimonas marina]|uniref:N-methyl-D-aspartate receptor NMDAR2C subunit n=1 Tax=Solimonas marina TaxID=2714601 RepID=A0A969WE55_9GAMM|nr:N-methyl-D-aspartate receptor NMDAR2C subunit [Solimonas marina]NKF23115.1 N-methyl-D-aspartate receptor NMDAR2C subunit [Solimonas marina]